MTLLRFRRRRRPVLDGDFDDDGESVTEILDRARPADWDGTTITFGGASAIGVMAISQPVPGTLPPALLPPGPYVPYPDTFPALPPAQPSGFTPVTEPAKFGDAIRLPVIWCEMPRCISWHHDPESAGFADSRDRATAAGWRYDALGRLACPSCQQSRADYRSPQPVRMYHPEVRRRWDSGHHAGDDTLVGLTAEAEYGRRVSREDPALARDIADATSRHGRHAGGAR